MYKATIITLMIFISACSVQNAPPTDIPATEVISRTTLEISGSGSITPVLGAIAGQFNAANPGYILEVLPGSGSGGGARGVSEGILDLAAMSRLPRDNDVEGDLEYGAFGISITAIYTHPDVGVTELSSEQLTDIFTGDITNWEAVGGENQPIVVYVRDPEEGNTTDIRETYIGDVDFISTAEVLSSQTIMKDTILNVSGAIGYGTWATALALEANVNRLIIDGSDGLDIESLQTVMGIAYLPDRATDAQVVIDWLLSDAGQGALSEFDIQPLSDEPEGES